MRIERKGGIAGDGEIVHREGVQGLVRFKLAGHGAHRANLGETIGDEEDEDDEGAIGGAFDLKVAEEGVGTEQVECLVDHVSLRRIR